MTLTVGLQLPHGALLLGAALGARPPAAAAAAAAPQAVHALQCGGDASFSTQLFDRATYGLLHYCSG